MPRDKKGAPARDGSAVSSREGHAAPSEKNQARLTFLVSVFGLSPVSEAFT